MYLDNRGGCHGMGITYFERRDVERDPIVQAVLSVYGEED